MAFFAEAIAKLEGAPHEGSSAASVNRMIQVKEMLDNLPPSADVRLVDLAVQHDMSVRSLSRHFRLAFGCMVVAYVAGLRMEQARIAIEGGELTIDQAAHLAGFSHASNFSSAFRRRYGYPPTAWSRGKADHA